jgi:hypothetical protein
MLYTSQAQIEAFLGRVLTAAELSILTVVVAAVERQIDKLLGTTFKNTAALYGATRYFDGGFARIDIDPVQNITSIQLISPDGSITDTLDSTNYVLWPKGENVTRMLQIRYGRVPKGLANLKIVGDFTEYAAEEAGVPSDIQLVATRVAGNIIANPDLSLGLKSESVEGHQVVFGDASSDPFKTDLVVANIIAARADLSVDDSPSLSSEEESDEEYPNY